MKVVYSALAIAILFISDVLAQRSKSDYIGEIFLRDGEIIKYTAISSEGIGTQILYSRVVRVEKVTGSRRYIDFENISRIDFLESDTKIKEDRNVVGTQAKITFHDGEVWDSLYIDPSAFMFWTPYDRGIITSKDAIAITFIPHDVKRCPQCSKLFPQIKFLYCPYDGTKLK